MYRVHIYKYAPIFVGADKRYRIELPPEAKPIVYKTLTSDMRTWGGQLVKSQQRRAQALVIEGGRVIEIDGELIAPIGDGKPCVVMEHLTIDGEMDFFIGNKNILTGNQNFANFGIPGGKHIRIDIYTGESKVVD